MCQILQEALDEITGHSSPYDILRKYKAGIPVNRVTLKHARIWVRIFKQLDWLNKIASVNGSPVLNTLYCSSLDGLCIRVAMVKTVRHWTGCLCQKTKVKLDTRTFTTTRAQLLQVHGSRWSIITSDKQKKLDLFGRQLLRLDMAVHGLIEKLSARSDVSYLKDESEAPLLYSLEWSEKKGSHESLRYT
jgi:hypothetical protein